MFFKNDEKLFSAQFYVEPTDDSGNNAAAYAPNFPYHENVSTRYFSHTNTNDDTDALNATFYNASVPIESCDTVYEMPGVNPTLFQVIIYVMYISILLLALVGNGTVCFIVQSSPRMRTVTNYFIANLAVGDILMSFFCVPFTFISMFILQYWPFGAILCRVVNYSQAVSVFVSAYTLVAISVDRYIAIMWPLRPRITKRYAKCIIFFVWFFAFLTALPISIMSKLIQPGSWHEQCDRYICGEDWPDPTLNRYYTTALMILQFIIPLCVLVSTYTRIAVAVWGKRPPGEAENSRDQRMHKSKRKMIKMMVTVVIVFTMCWAPFNILGIIVAESGGDSELLPYFWLTFHWLAMSHSCYNPIIYCYMNARFRSGFITVLHTVPLLGRCGCLQRCSARQRSGSNATHLAHTGIDEVSQMHRNNTCTTFISTKRISKTSNAQIPYTSAETVLR
ncbi:RYamide receptor [Culicoides brevitarsis]|uniref:RYamide receptor n=1 Tax=Culicoides brevitarsis TaxID=469753 RepID=UPI00307C8F0C